MNHSTMFSETSLKMKDIATKLVDVVKTLPVEAHGKILGLASELSLMSNDLDEYVAKEAEAAAPSEPNHAIRSRNNGNGDGPELAIVQGEVSNASLNLELAVCGGEEFAIGGGKELPIVEGEFFDDSPNLELTVGGREEPPIVDGEGSDGALNLELAKSDLENENSEMIAEVAEQSDVQPVTGAILASKDQAGISKNEMLSRRTPLVTRDDLHVKLLALMPQYFVDYDWAAVHEDTETTSSSSSSPAEQDIEHELNLNRGGRGNLLLSIREAGAVTCVPLSVMNKAMLTCFVELAGEDGMFLFNSMIVEEWANVDPESIKLGMTTVWMALSPSEYGVFSTLKKWHDEKRVSSEDLQRVVKKFYGQEPKPGNDSSAAPQIPKPQKDEPNEKEADSSSSSTLPSKRQQKKMAKEKKEERKKQQEKEVVKMILVKQERSIYDTEAKRKIERRLQKEDMMRKNFNKNLQFFTTLVFKDLPKSFKIRGLEDGSEFCEERQKYWEGRFGRGRTPDEAPDFAFFYKLLREKMNFMFVRSIADQLKESSCLEEESSCLEEALNFNKLCILKYEDMVLYNTTEHIQKKTIAHSGCQQFWLLFPNEIIAMFRFSTLKYQLIKFRKENYERIAEMSEHNEGFVLRSKFYFKIVKKSKRDELFHGFYKKLKEQNDNVILRGDSLFFAEKSATMTEKQMRAIDEQYSKLISYPCLV